MKYQLFFWSLLTTLSSAQNPIFIPSILSGNNIALNLNSGTHQFYSGINTATMGANGNILAPTLILNQGEIVNMQVTNNLSDTTTIHWHGMHVAPENDGGPHSLILPGSTWSPSFTILDKASTYWYHPHLHHKTDKHLSKGISGMIIVKDSLEATLALPRTYGVDDFPIIIQTKGFDANNEIEVHTNADDVLMVNATINPSLQIPAQVIRLRVLNASAQRVFNLGLDQNRSFYHIASDGGLLNNAESLTRLMLAPGERAELLIDASSLQGQTISLKSYTSELPNVIYGAAQPGMGQMMTLNNYSPNTMNGTDFNVLALSVIAPTSNPIHSIPSSLENNVPLDENSSNITRTITMTPLSMGQNALNGASFDMNVINYNIPLNNTEIWTLVNQTPIAHPFHIHDVQFYILEKNPNRKKRQ